MWNGVSGDFAVEFVYVFRLVLSIGCGALIGLERERRQKTAGIRTHILVALSSALMVIVSKYGFFDVISIDGISIDASRIAASAVSAVGFIGTGVIFVRRDSTMGLTTAAGLWATVGVGIAIGAGMYVLGITATVLILILQAFLHIRHFKVMTHLGGEIKVDLSRHDITAHEIRQRLSDHGIACRTLKIKRTADSVLFSAQLYFPPDADDRALIEQLMETSWVDEFTVFSVN